MADTVFITGADKGLGFSLAGRFLRGGFQVFAGAYTPAFDFSGLEREDPGRLTAVPLDVTDLESVCRAAAQVAGKTRALDVLVNNAGIHLDDPALHLEGLDLADQHLEKTMQVNAFGPLRVTQQFLPLLNNGRRKLIVNISSEAGSIADCKRSAEYAYCMSKAALNMQSRILQNYLGPQGFKVLAVQPGWMRTDMGGPGADIHPDQSAEGIFKLAVKSWKPDGLIYLDYQGNPLPW